MRLRESTAASFAVSHRSGEATANRAERRLGADDTPGPLAEYEPGRLSVERLVSGLRRN